MLGTFTASICVQVRTRVIYTVFAIAIHLSSINVRQLHFTRYPNRNGRFSDNINLPSSRSPLRFRDVCELSQSSTSWDPMEVGGTKCHERTCKLHYKLAKGYTQSTVGAVSAYSV